MIEGQAEELLKIKEKFGIENERFQSGVEFALRIQDGVNKNSAYSYAFKCTREQARNRSSQLYRTKWIQEIIKATEVEDELRDIQSREDIKQSMTDIMSAEVEATKDRIAAARVLLSATEKKQKEKETEVASAQSTAREILNHVKLLAEENKMISISGEVVDIEVVE